MGGCRPGGLGGGEAARGRWPGWLGRGERGRDVGWRGGVACPGVSCLLFHSRTKGLSPPGGGWQRQLRRPLLQGAGEAPGWGLRLALVGLRAARGLPDWTAQLCGARGYRW